MGGFILKDLTTPQGDLAGSLAEDIGKGLITTEQANRILKGKPKITWSDVTDIELDGISMSDYPDFCDAFISYAYHIKEERDCTDAELEELMEDDCAFYDEIMSWIH